MNLKPFIICATAIAVAGSTTMTATPATATTGSTAVWTCSKGAQKPSKMNIWCYHASVWTKKMRWLKWSPSKAIARGTYVVNSCDITCAEGPFYNYEARFEFSKPRYFTAFEGTSTQLRRSGYLFTKMRVRFTGEWPRGRDQRPYVLKMERGSGGRCELIWRKRGERMKPC